MFLSRILFLALSAGGLAQAGQSGAVELYEQAVLSWRADGFREAIRAADTSGMLPRSEADLLKGLCYWRLTVLASMDGDREGIRKYADTTVQQMLECERIQGETVLSVAVRGMAYQMLSGLGAASAIRNGPRSADAIAWLEKNEPSGYWARLLRAINRLNAPGVAGGNPDKALAGLQAMSADYPDSLAVAVHLALAHHRKGDADGARRALDKAGARHPGDRWIARTKADIGTKKKD